MIFEFNQYQSGKQEHFVQRNSMFHQVILQEWLFQVIWNVSEANHNKIGWSNIPKTDTDGIQVIPGDLQ